jgi:hypothetical protein
MFYLFVNLLSLRRFYPPAEIDDVLRWDAYPVFSLSSRCSGYAVLSMQEHK